jgi:catecholate siderophore receptor
MMLILRGSSTTADFVDGVRDDVQLPRLYNTERVEALKGPNAMVFGRGGAGGVINRSTLQANRAGQVNLQFGSHDNRRDVRSRPAAAAPAARLTGIREFRQPSTGPPERYGFNPTAAYLLGNETTIRLDTSAFMTTAQRIEASRHPATVRSQPEHRHSSVIHTEQHIGLGELPQQWSIGSRGGCC